MMMYGLFIVLLVSFVSICQCAKSSKATKTASETTASDLSSTTIASQSSSTSCSVTFPTPTNTTTVSATLNITSDTDFNFTRFTAASSVGGSTENEKDHPILYLADGVTIKNVIIGINAAKGIWCRGSCTLINVWWESVATHAGNFGADSAYWANTANKYTIQGGGVQNAGDKVFIQQGAGTTYITDFFAQDVSKLWRSCGDCPTQFKNRQLVLTDSTVKGPVLTVVGVNDDQGDTFSLNGLNLCDYKTIKYVCQAYKSNTNYNTTTGANYSEHPDEEFAPGQTLNGASCKDPDAKINLIS